MSRALPLLTILFFLAASLAPGLAAAEGEDPESPWTTAEKDKKKKDEDDKKKKDADDKAAAEAAAKAEAEPEAEAEASTEEAEAAEQETAPEAEAEAAQPEAQVATSPQRRAPGIDTPAKGGGPVGLGFAVGTINGLSLKIWPHRAHGMVLHLGVPNLLNSVATSLSYRVHPKPIVIPGSGVALHVNLGPLFRARAVFSEAVYVELAGGLALGVSVTVQNVPAELFFEVAPLFAGSVTTVGTGLGFGVDGVVGARFYF